MSIIRNPTSSNQQPSGFTGSVENMRGRAGWGGGKGLGFRVWGLVFGLRI